MKKPLIAVFLAFSLVFPATAGAASRADESGSRYLVNSTKAFWRVSFGARHVFEDGFTADLNDFQVKLARFAGLKPIPVKKFYILAEDPVISPSATPVPSASPARSVDWGVQKMIGAGAVRAKGGADVIVAVLDTGVDRTHPDLSARIVSCADLADLTVGMRDDACDDLNGHGTHVAGIIAADGGAQGTGMFGVAPEASLAIFRVCNRDGLCYSDDIAVAIRKAVDAGAQIISLGMGGESQSSFIDEALAYATDKGVMIVAAAGNDGPYDDSVDWPARDVRVISVGALASDGTVPAFSSQGNNVATKAYHAEEGDIQFVAPGVNVESTFIDGGYAILSGTSMAAPHIAGLAARTWQSEAAHPAQATRTLLQELAHDIAPEGDDNASGWGVPMLKEKATTIEVAE